MKRFFANLIAGLLFAGLSLGAVAADKAADKKAEKGKPYPLKKCLVSDEDFGGDMGEPYVFTHKGREVKLCCKGCLKEFNKNTEKYVKKMAAADKK